jgi:hypothetical protein
MSRDEVTIDGVWIGDRIYGTRAYTSVLSHCLHWLLGRGFQRRTWVITLSLFLSLSLSKVRVTSRLTIYRQLFRLGVKHLETHDQFFFQLTLKVIALM